MNEELNTAIGPKGEELKTSMHQDRLPIRNLRVRQNLHERLARSEADEPNGEELSKSL